MLDCIVDKWHLDREKTCMVGDRYLIIECCFYGACTYLFRLDTDIAFGKLGGISTLLVLTGVTKMPDLLASEIKPDFLIESLGCLL